MSFDPYAPYGRVVESAVRVVTWNVWGRYGPDWQTRQAALEAVLAEVRPEVICLVESWRQGESSQPAPIAGRLGLPHHHFVGDWAQEDWVSGIGLACRWPMSEPRHRALRAGDGAGAGSVVHVTVDGERGPIQLFAVMLDYPLDASAVRQGQVKQLVQFVQETTSRRDPVILCGDFNAGPDSDEIRMLTGRAATAVPGMVFYDSWEMAGDGSAGYTWSNRNPLAAIGLYPDRRFDTSSPPGRAAVASGTRSTVSCSESARPTRSRYPITTACWRISVIEQRVTLDGRTALSERAG